MEGLQCLRCKTKLFFAVIYVVKWMFSDFFPHSTISKFPTVLSFLPAKAYGKDSGQLGCKIPLVSKNKMLKSSRFSSLIQKVLPQGLLSLGHFEQCFFWFSWDGPGRIDTFLKSLAFRSQEL